MPDLGKGWDVGELKWVTNAPHALPTPKAGKMRKDGVLNKKTLWAPVDDLPVFASNPRREAWESCVCMFSGTSKTGRTQLDLANARAPGSRNSQAQRRTPRVWAPSQDVPVTSTRWFVLPVAQLPGRAGHKRGLWLRGPTF